MLTSIPAELLLHIIQFIPSINDKCQLMQTCKYLRQFLSCNLACWSNLDFSLYDKTLNNNHLLTFLKNMNISLIQHNTNMNNNIAITRLDLSGCWNISETLLEALCKSLPHLNELCLNGYRLNNRDNLLFDHFCPLVAFEQHRDHIYQVRPSHDLSSMTMDLSKNSNYQLKIPLILLVNIINNLCHLKSLSIQYQDISLSNNKRSQYDLAFSALRNIQYLDISSCTISQHALHSLLQSIGSNLTSLKMLNIDLNYIICLTITQRCRYLKCLHVSCNTTSMINVIRQMVSTLSCLEDFRLTRIRTGEIDSLIELLKPGILKRLDLSPKMNIYPRPSSTFKTAAVAAAATATAAATAAAATTTTTTTTTTTKIHGQYGYDLSNFATIEHDLLFSDKSLGHLMHCQHLVELRLCFPIISPTALHSLFKSIPQLEIFELRQQKGLKSREDFLTGLKLCKKLKELYLFSVFVSLERLQEWISEDYSLKSTLKHVILTDTGPAIETDLAYFLSNMTVLKTLCLGHLVQPIHTMIEGIFLHNRNINDLHNVILFRQNIRDEWHLQ
ncbi:uncharacterized protein BX663DRAFT_501300 [Cokeromyces recurvatus]|uniref:uncharacterized protein n=1 Tax=Cokeromyces recurvatus TaxID=90255 RepID=UPI00221FFA19|nr:uncharacterized protein BX663DRAFT_501300 [Cokeromyces recurvatus]KAI7904997.1 hypothetical protein BX663DRAFT_501300 [Cokeromyces recurvatus]